MKYYLKQDQACKDSTLKNTLLRDKNKETKTQLSFCDSVVKAGNEKVNNYDLAIGEWASENKVLKSKNEKSEKWRKIWKKTTIALSGFVIVSTVIIIVIVKIIL